MENLQKEKEIIHNIVLDSRDELIELLQTFQDNQDEFDVKYKIAEDIIEYIVKVVFKLNRFNEFKSKFKILEKGSRISKKELERCDFVIKLNKNKMTIVKNTLNDIKGVFISKWNSYLIQK